MPAGRHPNCLLMRWFLVRWQLVRAIAIVVPAMLLMAGCFGRPPLGSPVDVRTVGSVVDEANRQQEENAEAAKLIVYMHEFEINIPRKAPEAELELEKFQFSPEQMLRGFRLTPAGQDHVRQIAQHVLASGYHSAISDPNHIPSQLVIVERGDTSKYWDTLHRYPVHYNDELDEARRLIVVNALLAFGIANADQMVVIAPAFPEGLSAEEAAAAYGNAFNNSGGFGNTGGRGGGGFGGGGFGGFQ